MKLNRLSEKIWISEPFEETDRPVLGLIRGDDKTLMIDAGNSPSHAEAFLSALERRKLPFPDLLAVTHAHCDHVFGLPVIRALLVANGATRDSMDELNGRDWNDGALEARVNEGLEDRMTLTMLRTDFPGDRTGFRLPEPDIVYERRIELNLGGLTARIEKIGGDHAKDSTIIDIPEEKVLFLGDCLYLRHETREVAEELYGNLLGHGAELFVDSHESRPFTRAELERKFERLIRVLFR